MTLIKKISYYSNAPARIDVVELEDKLHIQLLVNEKKVSGTYLMKKSDNEAEINKAKDSLALRYCVDKNFSV